MADMSENELAQWRAWADHMVMVGKRDDEGQKIVCEYFANIVQQIFGSRVDMEERRVYEIAFQALMWLGQPKEREVVKVNKKPFQYDLTKRAEG